MVAFEPGRITRSHTGSASPARTSIRSTSGSAASGSRSSKLAIQGSTGTTIRIGAPGRRDRCEIFGILGRQQTGLREERHQAQRRPAGARGDRRHAIGEQRQIAAHPVDDEAHHQRCIGVGRARRACRPGWRSRRPGRCRPPPPPARRRRAANPMLAMSPSRRLTSDALPAPSTSTMSAASRRREKLSSTRGSRPGFIA